MTFMLHENHQRPLKSLKFKTLWALIRQCYNDDKQSFRENPNHKIMGLSIYHLHFELFQKWRQLSYLIIFR
jgi:hypothetical protein